jgi:hypothetical protein
MQGKNAWSALEEYYIAPTHNNWIISVVVGAILEALYVLYRNLREGKN